jgi:hypothetical protein
MSVASAPTPEIGGTGQEWMRVRAYCRKHWLGLDVPAERQAAADAVRQSYFTTAVEHHKAATRMYELLTTPEQHAGAGSTPSFAHISRHIQLLLTYSTLWDAFRAIYNAACYTHFGRGEAEIEPMETERDKIDRVLRPPLMPEAEFAAISTLRNGETPAGAIRRFCSRHSRELEQIDGAAHEITMTSMDAYMQGVVRDAGQPNSDASPWELWGVRALDETGRQIDPEETPTIVAYRAVITWLCYQLRLNINFVNKSDDSLDDMILVMRAFCLLEPIVGILLSGSRKDPIFALP